MDIDLNADLGEGAGFDAALMPLVTSANVCCGAHAGDPVVLRATLELAAKHGVAVGAHPGYPDRENFGRLDLPLSPADVRTHCQYQVGGPEAVARIVPVAVRYEHKDVPWVGQDPFLPHYVRTTFRTRTRVFLEFGEAIDPACFDGDAHARSRALTVLAHDARITVGELEGARLPIVTETGSLTEGEELTTSLADLPGVAFVDVVSVDFSDEG